jgi:hypothetical protein
VLGGVTTVPTAGTSVSGSPLVAGVTPAPTAGTTLAGSPVVAGVTPAPTAGTTVAGSPVIAGVTPAPTAATSVAGSPVGGGIIPPSVSTLVPPTIAGILPDALNTSNNVTRTRQIANHTELNDLFQNDTDLIIAGGVSGQNISTSLLDSLTLNTSVSNSSFSSSLLVPIFNDTSFLIYQGGQNNSQGQLRNESDINEDVFDLDQYSTIVPKHSLNSSAPSFSPILIVNITMTPTSQIMDYRSFSGVVWKNRSDVDDKAENDPSLVPSLAETSSPTSSAPSGQPTFVEKTTRNPSHQMTFLSSEQKRQHENEVVKTITESRSTHNSRSFHFSDIDLDEIISEAKQVAGVQDSKK